MRVNVYSLSSKYKEGIKNVNSKVISLFVQKVFYKSFICHMLRQPNYFIKESDCGKVVMK